jgi:hypothetical protein
MTERHRDGCGYSGSATGAQATPLDHLGATDSFELRRTRSCGS